MLKYNLLQGTGYDVEVDTTFDQFVAHISADARSESLDRGNIRLTFNSVSSYIIALCVCVFVS